MNKEQVAAILDEIGTLLELKGENTFRCNAYHNGARAIEQLETDLGDLVAQGKLGEIPGIGDTLKEKITTLVTTGKLPFYEDLKQTIPAGLVQMLRIQGLGPKKVKAMYDQLGIDTLDKLGGLRTGHGRRAKGFGAKTQQKILEGLAFLDHGQPRAHRSGPAPGPEPARRLARSARRPAHGAVRQLATAQGNHQGHRHPHQLRHAAPIMDASSSCPASCKSSARARPSRASLSAASRSATRCR